jgi:NitT/TauT family transport system permease protein
MTTPRPVSPPIPRLGLHVATTIAYLVVIIAIWYGYVRIASVPTYLLPSPELVGSALVGLVASGRLWANLAYTSGNILLGFVAGVAIGIALGYVLRSFRLFRELAAPYVVILQATPKIALAPLLVLWFGLGLPSQLVLILALTFFPMMVATELGFASIPADVGALARLLGMGRTRYLFSVQLPGALPQLFSGAKIAIVDAMTGAFLAEYIAAQRGLGYLMVLGNTSYNIPMLVAAIVVTVAVGLLGFGVISAVERAVVRWQPTS